MADEIEQEGRQQAEQLLLDNGDALGLLGNRRAYQQVWARDSMIGSLGLLLCADPHSHAIHRRSLETLRQHQSPLGKIPHHVGRAGVLDPALIAYGGALGEAGDDDQVLVDTAHAGCVDSNLWYILGHYLY